MNLAKGTVRAEKPCCLSAIPAGWSRLINETVIAQKHQNYPRNTLQHTKQIPEGYVGYHQIFRKLFSQDISFRSF